MNKSMSWALAAPAILLATPAHAQDAELACVSETIAPEAAQALTDAMLAEQGLGAGSSFDYQSALNESTLTCIIENSVGEALIDTYIEGSIAAVIHPLISELLIESTFPIELAGEVSAALQADPELDVDQYILDHPAGLGGEIAQAASRTGLTDQHLRIFIGTYVAIDAMLAGARSRMAGN